MRPGQHRQVSRHQFKQEQTAKERKSERAEKSFPCLFRADMRRHQVTADRAAGQVSAHVAKFCDRDQVQDIKLPGHHSSARPRRQVKDFRREIEKPKNVEQAKQRVSHRL